MMLAIWSKSKGAPTPPAARAHASSAQSWFRLGFGFGFGFEFGFGLGLGLGLVRGRLHVELREDGAGRERQHVRPGRRPLAKLDEARPTAAQRTHHRLFEQVRPPLGPQQRRPQQEQRWEQERTQPERARDESERARKASIRRQRCWCLWQRWLCPDDRGRTEGEVPVVAVLQRRRRRGEDAGAAGEAGRCQP